jgi:UDP-glucuronate 4-epimerase
MSPSLFAGAILRDEPIDVFNEGKMQRDFTYIDDIVEGVLRVLENIPGPSGEFDTDNPDPSSSYAPYRVYNIGNNEPVQLMDFIKTIENAVGKEAQKNMLPMQDGDVVATYADIEELTRAVGFRPSTSLKEGIERFVTWYRNYHGY